eukprot:2903885-Rhodomonas_salina.1
MPHTTLLLRSLRLGEPEGGGAVGERKHRQWLARSVSTQAGSDSLSSTRVQPHTARTGPAKCEEAGASGSSSVSESPPTLHAMPAAGSETPSSDHDRRLRIQAGRLRLRLRAGPSPSPSPSPSPAQLASG